MANSFERGLSGSQVSDWAQNDTFTPKGFASTVNPYGLKLQQTILSTYRTESIYSISGSGTVVTVTCQHGFLVGQTVTISGVNPSAYNITGVITSIGLGYGWGTSFTINSTATGTYVSGGTVTSGVLPTPPVPFVYAVVVGGGGAMGSYAGVQGAGGGGGVTWGWTQASQTCVVGYGGNVSNGGLTRYGNLMAGGGGCAGYGTGAPGTSGAGGAFLGGAGCYTFGNGWSSSNNYWGIPGSNYISQGGISSTTANVMGGNGGDGISGGGGGMSYGASTLVGNVGGKGGNGMTGGGGGTANNSTISNTPAYGGNGYSLLTNSVSYGGAPFSIYGGGGGGTVSAGGNATASLSGAGGIGGGGGGSSQNGSQRNVGGQGAIHLYW